MTHNYFQEMEKALELNDENDPSENYPVFYLSCGDIHVCRGAQCPHVSLTYEKSYVCSLSGHCCGALSVREDFSTGRQVGSANPDDRGGLPVGGQWAKKVDMFSMSTAAYVGANSFEDEFGCDPPKPGRTALASSSNAPGGTTAAAATPPFGSSQAAQRTGGTPEKKAIKVKRGARCVDEEDEELPRRKRCLNVSADLERQASLKQDVTNTLCKLVNFSKDGKSAKQRDARLQDRAFVTSMAIKKYIKECLSSGSTPNLDDIHNISITAANVAAEEKRRATSDGRYGPLILKVRMRETTAALVVALWTACLRTPYMQNQRRGADSFRPFCVGVCYALKRGVSLPDGTTIVPECSKLAESLPTLRSAAPNSTAKALHASSHRGLCTLHRCVSSCTQDQASELYAAAAGIAGVLKRDAAAGRYDL